MLMRVDLNGHNGHIYARGSMSKSLTEQGKLLVVPSRSSIFTSIGCKMQLHVIESRRRPNF